MICLFHAYFKFISSRSNICRDSKTFSAVINLVSITQTCVCVSCSNHKSASDYDTMFNPHTWGRHARAEAPAQSDLLYLIIWCERWRLWQLFKSCCLLFNYQHVCVCPAVCTRQVLLLANISCSPSPVLQSIWKHCKSDWNVAGPFMSLLIYLIENNTTVM